MGKVNVKVSTKSTKSTSGNVVKGGKGSSTSSTSGNIIIKSK